MTARHLLYTFSPAFFHGKKHHPLCQFIDSIIDVTTIDRKDIQIVYLDQTSHVPAAVAQADKPCLLVDIGKPKQTLLTRVALRTWFELQVRTDQTSMDTYDRICKVFEAEESGLIQADTDRVEALISTGS
jgi:hypothetical protein